MTTAPVNSLPSFHLLCMNEEDIVTFEAARQAYQLPASVTVTFHNARLGDLDPTLRFDAIVSPANSYARMDGGFDDALSRAFSPREDYLALTRVAQAALYTQFRGFAPPGSCLIVSLKGEKILKENAWGCKYLALCPTMKVPSEVRWDREVVYECVWTLLAAIDRHNREIRERRAQNQREREGCEIQSVLMTPLATGCGLWSAQKWAAQTIIAIRHFKAALENESGVKMRGPVEIMTHSAEVEKTYDL